MDILTVCARNVAFWSSLMAQKKTDWLPLKSSASSATACIPHTGHSFPS